MDWLERIDPVIRIEKVSKIESAERQLCTAIRLFFGGGDSVSIHTLGWAAHEILARSTGSGGSLLLEDLVSTSEDSTARRQLEEAMRFFTHHQGAQFKTIKFIENLNEWLLFDGAMMHRQLTGTRLRETQAISAWMAVRFPHVVPFKITGMPDDFVSEAFEQVRIRWGCDKGHYLHYIENRGL